MILLDHPKAWIIWVAAVPIMLGGLHLAEAAPSETAPNETAAPEPITAPPHVAPNLYPTTTVPCTIHYADPGDSWWLIAQRTNLDPWELLDYNGATPDTLILIGDPICLPPGTAITPASTTTTTTASSSTSPATTRTAPTNSDPTTGSTQNPAPTPSPSSTPPAPTTTSETPPTVTKASSNGQWNNPIPAYRPGSACTQAEADVVAHKFRHVGASDDTITWALNVFSRESGCDNTAHNNNPATRDNSYGLCQLNARAGFFNPGKILAAFNPQTILTDFGYSVDACITLWQTCGRGPWSYGNYYCRKPTS